MSSTGEPWEALALDIQAKIFSHLGSVPDLMRSALVCKQFQDIILHSRYKTCGHNIVLQQRVSNPDDNFSRIVWEPNTNRLIFWYSAKPVSLKDQRHLKAILRLIGHIEVEHDVLVLPTRSTPLFELVFSGKWPIMDDFRHVPAIVRHNCPPSDYPVSTDMAFVEATRLADISGLPKPLPIFSQEQEYWREGTIIFPCLKLRERILDRGFDVNEEGWLVVMSPTKLRVYKPNGSGFESIAEKDVLDAPQLHRVRVRYRGKEVIVFSNYKLRRYFVDESSSTVTMLSEFADDYSRQQSFKDIDVRGKFVVAVWQKWVGFYRREDFAWFHAVSMTSVPSQPKSVVFKNDYIHVSNGTCVFAFHPASRDPMMLWVNGNLPEAVEDDTPFCVSTWYGVFTLVHGDVIQSYYHAALAQPVYNDSASLGDGIPCPTPRPFERDPKNHIISENLHTFSPFEKTEHIEYDECFGRHGRLLCWDSVRSMIFMVLNRSEFQPALDFVQREFETILLGVFQVGETVEIELADRGWTQCVVEDICEDSELVVKLDNRTLRKQCGLPCRSLDVVDRLSEKKQLELRALFGPYFEDYGEDLINFVLLKALRTDVSSGDDGTIHVRFRRGS